MSDYSQTTFFKNKDALPTGDGEKVISSVDIDDEFDAIKAAIVTKGEATAIAITETTGTFTPTWTGWDDDPSAGNIRWIVRTDGTTTQVIFFPADGTDQLGKIPAEGEAGWSNTPTEPGAFLELGATSRPFIGQLDDGTNVSAVIQGKVNSTGPVEILFLFGGGIGPATNSSQDEAGWYGGSYMKFDVNAI